MVKIFPTRRCNQQVTKDGVNFSNSVGTSETTRAALFKKDAYFNQWLSGLIDGDGTLQVSKKGYSSCEITVALSDERMLRIIQNKLGGSVKIRSGARAVRWRIHDKTSMINLISRINGNIRHTTRLLQLNKVCANLNLDVIDPSKISKNNAWFAGFFDADGTIGYYFKNGYPQLTISVTNKLKCDIEHFHKVFGGNVYFDKGQNGYYKWTIQSKCDIFKFIDYTKSCPPKSIKLHRLHLVNTYYKLRELKAYSKDNNAFHKAWIVLKNKWEKY